METQEEDATKTTNQPGATQTGELWNIEKLEIRLESSSMARNGVEFN
jgi:hypothetical protein